MLQNAYFLAKIGADTAENERNFAEILPKFGNYPTGLLPVSFSARVGPAARIALRPQMSAGTQQLARWTGAVCAGIYVFSNLNFWNWQFCKFLVGSFSAVSKQNFARKYAFDSIFRALQDLHIFAPLRSQNFSKNSVWKFSNFCKNSAKILQMLQILQNIAKFQKIQLDNLVDFEKCCKTRI